MAEIGSFTSAFEKVSQGPLPLWFHQLRADAFARFRRQGLPTRRDEPWKYTSLAPLEKLAFAQPASDSPRWLSPAVLESEHLAPRAVFIDGRFDPKLSDLSGLPAGVEIRPLSEALAKPPSWLEPALLGAEGALSSLNAAFCEDGLVVDLAPQALLERPIRLVFLRSPLPDPTMAHPRILVRAGEGSRASLVETYLGSPEGAYLTNALTQVELENGARLTHHKVQREGGSAFHISRLQASLGASSQLVSHVLQVGAKLARNEVAVRLGGGGARCDLNGLSLGKGEQHQDSYTWVDHAQPQGQSAELYKSILDGRAHGVFFGQVNVRPGAIQTDATQANHNLLLSDDATADTRPQLEIFADDVKCTHGATVGQLDEDALFYLRSRGLPEARARSLLTYAFAGEMIEKISDPSSRSQVERCLSEALQ